MRTPGREERIAALAEADRRRLETAARRERRRRLGWLVGAWALFVVPGLVMSWFLLGWVVTPLFAAALAWTSWDYYKRGGMAEAVDSSARIGGYLPGMFTKQDR